MRTTKKAVALLLSVLMLFTMVSSTSVAFAASETTETATRAAARVSLTTKVKEAEVGDKISTTVKVENDGDAAGEIKLTVFATPYANGKIKTKSLGKMAVGAKATEKYSAVARDFSIIENSDVQEILDLVVGGVLPVCSKLSHLSFPVWIAHL